MQQHYIHNVNGKQSISFLHLANDPSPVPKAFDTFPDPSGTVPDPSGTVPEPGKFTTQYKQVAREMLKLVMVNTQLGCPHVNV